MLPGPVFTFELLALARRRRYYALRFAYGFLLLFLVWQNNPENYYPGNATPLDGYSIQQLGVIGYRMFATFSVTQAVVILMITPALVAGVIAEEKQRKTLHYLLASCLSSGEIVLGKLAARMLAVGVFLGVGLPILAMLSFFGGVDPNLVLLSFLCCLSTAFLIASASVAVSVHAKRPREAVSLMYLGEPVWLFGPSIASAVLPMAGGFWSRLYDWVRPVNEWVGASSPFFVMVSGGLRGANPAAWYEAVAWMIGLQALYGAILVALAVARLRPVHRAGEARGGRVARVFSRAGRRFLPRPECGDDAVLWKERYVSRTSPYAKAAGVLVFAGVVALLSYTTYEFAKPSFDEVLSLGYLSAAYDGPAHRGMNEYLRFVLTVIYVCWVLAVASAASNGLSGEREEDTWVSLLATPLTPAEIVRAKMFGALWSSRWVGFLWLLLLGTGAVLGAVHPFGVVAELHVTAVYLWFACALGTFFSLRARSSSRSLTATVSTLLVCNGVYLLLLLPIRMESSFRLLGVTPTVCTYALLSYPDMKWMTEGFPRGLDGTGQQLDLLTTSFSSFLAYGLSAATITAYLVLNFDDAIDRPRTEGARRPVSAFKPRKDESDLD